MIKEEKRRIKQAKESRKRCRCYAPERVYSAKTGNARAKGELENKM